jgi:hypothetical protein
VADRLLSRRRYLHVERDDRIKQILNPTTNRKTTNRVLADRISFEGRPESRFPIV